jgi:hypothetical protein
MSAQARAVWLTPSWILGAMSLRDPAWPMLDLLRNKASTRRVRAVAGSGRCPKPGVRPVVKVADNVVANQQA